MVRVVRRIILFTLTVLAFALAVACASSAPEPVTPKQRVAAPERTAVAVVLIGLHLPDMPPYPNNVYVSCGGVAIGPRTVLTSAHCVLDDGVPKETVLFRTREQYRLGQGIHAATPRFIDQDRDIALLRTKEYVFPEFAKVRSVSVSDMTVELVREFQLTVADSPMAGLLQVPIKKGESGSPVFGLDGAVIGVVRGCFYKPFISDLCVPELGGTYTPVMP